MHGCKNVSQNSEGTFGEHRMGFFVLQWIILKYIKKCKTLLTTQAMGTEGEKYDSGTNKPSFKALRQYVFK